MTPLKILKDTKTRQIYHTHVSMGKYKAKYAFSRSHIYDFFDCYDPESIGLCLAEKPHGTDLGHAPVLVDIDIKRPLGDHIERGPEHVLGVIKAYQEVLKCIVEDVKPRDLTCVFLDKPPYEITQNGTTYIKNGFHLHFPYLFLNRVNQSIHLIPRVRQLIKERETFKNLGFEDMSKLIDDVSSKPWLIYGCSKEEGLESYKISKIFDCELNEISIEKAFSGYPVVDKHEKIISLTSQDSINKNIPRILSILPILRDYSLMREIRQGLVLPTTETREPTGDRKNKRTPHQKPPETLLKEASSLIKILDDHRASSYDDWLKVGWILYDIDPEEDGEGFKIWNDFSKRCEEKYTEAGCLNTWSKMSYTGELTIGTLHYYAKIDNKKEYMRFIKEHNKDILHESLNGSHYDIAKIFQQVYGYNNVRITDQKNLTCFIWDDNKKLWITQGKESLRKKISDIIVPIYIKVAKNFFDELESLKGNNQKDAEAKCTAKIKQVQKMISNLKQTPYVNNVAQALAGYDIDKDFETTINRKASELPIKNGRVINLKTLEVRDRCPEDFWSFECDVEFLGEKADLSMVDKFFNDICCGSENLVDYHRRLWGYMLTGEISDRSLHILWGSGCNGKSSIINIFANITSGFTAALSEDVMLKKTSRGANPEMMPLLTARCGTLPESDKKEEINSKRVKSITGDDVITARHLFGHPVSFKTQCKPIWATNHKPKINIDDKAILDRLKLIPFLARFEKNQKNTNYIKNLQETYLSEFFTWFCFGAYDWYQGRELIPCKEMTDEMDKYISENDVVGEFIEDTYELITKDLYAKLPKLEKSLWVQNRTHVFGEFVVWLTDNNRKDDAMGKKDFYTQLDKKVTHIKTNKITKGFMAKRKDIPMDFPEDDEDGRPPM